jgi:hypothetical protein
MSAHHERQHLLLQTRQRVKHRRAAVVTQPNNVLIFVTAIAFVRVAVYKTFVVAEI